MSQQTTESLVISGRTRYSDRATTRIEVRRYRNEAPLLVIYGGLIEEKNGGAFTISAKHESATDEEHDASYVAYLDGAGFQFSFMNPQGFEASGVILKAAYYTFDEPAVPHDECDRCQEPHGFLKFSPDSQPWEPGIYYLNVEFL